MGREGSRLGGSRLGGVPDPRRSRASSLDSVDGAVGDDGAPSPGLPRTEVVCPRIGSGAAAALRAAGPISVAAYGAAVELAAAS